MPNLPEPPVKPPLSAEAIMDMRGRVLRGEPVSDEELQHALDSLQFLRSGAVASSATAKAAKAASTPVIATPTESLADRMARFKSKKASSA